ncbi:MAG TPA: hypothetical protein DEF45_06890 [Rhodopirellula sp.]|nr:hypothetical protein [Rhodopirellula sp.]
MAHWCTVTQNSPQVPNLRLGYSIDVQLTDQSDFVANLALQDRSCRSFLACMTRHPHYRSMGAAISAKQRENSL